MVTNPNPRVHFVAIMRWAYGVATGSVGLGMGMRYEVLFIIYLTLLRDLTTNLNHEASYKHPGHPSNAFSYDCRALALNNIQSLDVWPLAVADA